MICFHFILSFHFQCIFNFLKPPKSVLSYHKKDSKKEKLLKIITKKLLNSKGMLKLLHRKYIPTYLEFCYVSKNCSIDTFKVLNKGTNMRLHIFDSMSLHSLITQF